MFAQRLVEFKLNLRKLLGWSVCVIWLSGGIAASETPLPTVKELAALVASRSPQPVRVGDLRDRKVMLPLESHRVLGRVADIVRLPDGQVDAVLNYGGFLGFGTHPIAVPTDAIALLGADLVMLGYTPGQLDQLPTFSTVGSTPVPPNDVIRMALTGPFH
jgi:hypothetical protein